MKIFSIVPQKYVYVLERFGKFHRLLKPGIRFMIPVIDQVAYKQHLMEEAIDIDAQTVITKDNVPLRIDGILFLQVEDAYKASYKIKDPQDSIKLLALTVMRSEIGKLKLDELLQEREKINREIHESVNKAANEWGINCLRYEILNIEPPEDIRRSMEYEVEAERTKRREILLAEAKRISQVNVKTGEKMHAVQLAEGKAEAIRIIADRESQAALLLNESLTSAKIKNYILMTKYLPTYQKILSSSNVVVAPQTAEGKESSLAAILLMMSGLTKREGYTQPHMEQANNETPTTATSTTSTSRPTPAQSRAEEDRLKIPEDEDLQMVKENQTEELKNLRSKALKLARRI